MTLTRDQQILIEPAIRRTWKSWAIARDFNLPLADVVEWRAERKRVVKAKRAIARDKRIQQANRDMVPLAGRYDRSSVDGGDLLTALRQHMPVLASLPDRVAVLGIPVVVRRAA